MSESRRAEEGRWRYDKGFILRTLPEGATPSDRKAVLREDDKVVELITPAYLNSLEAELATTRETLEDLGLTFDSLVETAGEYQTMWQESQDENEQLRAALEQQQRDCEETVRLHLEAKQRELGKALNERDQLRAALAAAEERVVELDNALMEIRRLTKNQSDVFLLRLSTIAVTALESNPAVGGEE